MSYAQNMYALTLDQSEALIKATGHHRTVLLQGPMGSGKSTLLNHPNLSLNTHLTLPTNREV